MFILALAVGTELRVYADFPPDMQERQVLCKPLERVPEEIEYYSDASLTQLKGSVTKSNLLLQASKVKEGAVYGIFDKEGQTQTGWFALTDFIHNPDYEDQYATVRSRMTVYTDSSLKKKKDVIKKYSGVIIIGKKGRSRQVIYQKKDAYGIGWMSGKTLRNTLLFDGREKQTLADGVYLFRSGYQDDANGGEDIIRQTGLVEDAACTWELIHQSGNNYYIKYPETEEYLAVSTHDRNLSYSLCRTGKADEKSGLFHLERSNGSYTIQSVKSGQFLAQNEKKELVLNRYRCGRSVSWRISAGTRMLNAKAPMVFTQYDPQWCGSPYGSEGCMGTAGCGILATVNAVYALSGQYMDVMELADYAVETGYRIVGSGTDEGIFQAACKKYGQKYNFAWDGKGKSMKQLKKKLAAGDTAVVHVQGHYVCIAAYDKEKNKYLLLDSNYLPKREDTAFGDWISPSRLVDGALESQGYYYFKLRDPLSLSPGT